MTTIKRRDTGQSFTASLKTIDGLPRDLTNCTVKFVMAKYDGTEVINAAATIVGSETDGTVKYTPVADDIDTTGNYLVEWHVYDSLGKRLSYPGTSYNELSIIPDLAL